MAPFCGVMIPVKLKELNQAQILSCGNFSLIETFEDKIRNNVSNFTPREIIAYSERHYNIIRESLLSPTFDEIMEICSDDFKTEEYKEKLHELKKKLEVVPSGKEKNNLIEEINRYEVWVNFILPDDFVAYVVAYALSNDKSDIKKISKEMLIDAAVLAEKGHDNPADHIEGRFTAFNRDDINRRAWYYLAKKREQHGR